jgi:hypothetical protein
VRVQHELALGGEGEKVVEFSCLQHRGVIGGHRTQVRDADARHAEEMELGFWILCVGKESSVFSFFEDLKTTRKDPIRLLNGGNGNTIEPRKVTLKGQFSFENISRSFRFFGRSQNDSKREKS